MAQDYPLEELSPRAFEQLTVALALQVLGPGVSAFGSGPDGGREATYAGPVNWSATTGFGTDSWNGRIVLQAKQREQLGSPSSNASWLREKMSRELDLWIHLPGRRNRLPNYLIFVTNVNLSGVASVGGIDSLNAYLRARIAEPIIGERKGDSLARRGLREVRIWHRDQLNGLLTVHDGIRRAFKGLLTVGDLLARLGELGGLLEPDLFTPVLKDHAQNALGQECWVNFRDIGGKDRESVENIVIDLKLERRDDTATTVLQELITRGDQVLKPRIGNTPRHVVLTGQPGSGKSTISQFITQMYRSRFVADEALTPTADAVRVGTDAALVRLGIRGPSNHRWPIRITLPQYADALGPDGDKMLIRWISERVTERAGIDIKPNVLKRWIQQWPCLVVLDGLDEVTSPDVRPRVLDAVRDFIEQSDKDDADLLVVMTTRPTGYTERFMPDRFDQLNLAYLDEETAVNYGRHVTARRLADDPDRSARLIQLFMRQTKEPAKLRLMKTPLQVLIITLILEGSGALPPDRYQLFWRYFDAIYQREQAKNTDLQELLANYRSAITDLHAVVGLALQVESEAAGDARAILPKPRLRELAMQRLAELGHKPGPATERIADRIIQATTQRLVLLVTGENDGVVFEIRSLQELMAARALSDATDDVVRSHLVAAAPSPHWRNSWVFAAGRLFAEGPDHRRDLVVEVVEQIDRSPGWPGWLSPVGPELAVGLLDDGMASTAPKWQERLVEVALRTLGGPDPERALAIINATQAAAPTYRAQVMRAIKATHKGAPVAQWIANQLDPPPPRRSTAAPQHGRARRAASTATKPIAELSILLAQAIGDAAISQEARDRLLLASEELAWFEQGDPWRIDHPRGSTPSVEARLRNTFAALGDPESAAVLRGAFARFDAEKWRLTASLSRLATPLLGRIPVGASLDAS